jgi:aldose sugar dehydrogenase
MINYILIVLSLLILNVSQGQNLAVRESEGMSYVVEEVSADIDDVPWGMAFINANEILVTRRSGSVIILNTDTHKIREISGAPKVMTGGQGGLMDVALPPPYKSTDWIYFSYTKNIADEGATTLARAKLKDDKLVEWSDLLVTKSITDTYRHFGGRIAFDGDGHLFFSVGERGERPNGQDLSTHAGSILRLKMDGTAADNNPFSSNKKGLPEIYSYGHRNPQGLSYDFENKRLWSNEHGPRGGDEINLILPGRNYGWPEISHGKEYWGPFDVGEGTERADVEAAVKVYIPSIAPSSLLYYSGKAFPKWQGNLFSGALKLMHLNRVTLDKNGKAIAEERLLKDLNERIRCLAQSPEGWIYLSTDSGRILRIRPE